MKKARVKYVLMLLAVVSVWGLDPLVNRYFYGYFSAAALSALSTLASAILFVALAVRHREKWDRRYLTVALPIALVNSLACVLQRIGLQYTSPTRYAFLEHLSCLSVPLVLLLFFRKRPSAAQWAAALLCLLGCGFLSGADILHGSIGIGDLLCAAAGLMLGVGIVTTARCTEGMDIRLFTAVHSVTYFLTSAVLCLSLHCIRVGGAPIEEIVLTPKPLPILAAVLFGLLSVGLCWLLRNEATRHLSPSLVAVITPLAALITAAISILRGLDTPTPAFFAACLFFLSAAILAGLGEKKGTAHTEKSPW